MGATVGETDGRHWTYSWALGAGQKVVRLLLQEWVSCHAASAAESLTGTGATTAETDAVRATTVAETSERR